MTMSYIKKSYCFKAGQMRTFAGHIKPATAVKNGFERVNLVLIDASGKGRGEERRYAAPFSEMKAFN